MDDLLSHPASIWLIVALVLAVAELAVPGVFLIFLGAAAAITALLVLLLPALTLAAQVGVFAAWSVVAVWLGRRLYRDMPIDSSDPLLNDRAARLLGETVTVTQAIVDGRGRVRVGDGEWPARGPDTPEGGRVRIVGASGTELKVAPPDTPIA